jgi:L-ascorbate metabolism protein UlaG (beta-lactamase superfamily)
MSGWTALIVSALAPVLLLTGCTASNPDYRADHPHHTPEGFRNNYPHMEPQSFWKWRWERIWVDVPPPPRNGYRFEVVNGNAAELRANRSETKLTWIGHATLLLQVGGVNVLTDPIFSERASPVGFLGPQRKVPVPIPLAELPHIEVVLVSHNHYDHLDLPTLRALNAQAGGPPTFFAPLGVGALLRDEGIGTVVEQDWWQFTELQGLRIHQVPAQHFSARTPFDRNEVLWGGFVVEHPALRFYFAGDTGYSRDFADIGERLGPIDLAALPIGSYEPRWFMRAMHINPDEAVQAHRDLGARFSVAMHWGTFEMTDEAIDEPPKALARALQAQRVPPERFFVMKHGETRRLAPLLEGRIARDGCRDGTRPDPAHPDRTQPAGAGAGPASATPVPNADC